jgi:xanthine dehydrogenase molybdopterin-binding subunit B
MSAAISIYADGSVLVTHGGVEMGQVRPCPPPLLPGSQAVAAPGAGINAKQLRAGTAVTDMGAMPSAHATLCCNCRDCPLK